MTDEIGAYIESRVTLGFDTASQICEDAQDVFGEDEDFPGAETIRRRVTDAMARVLDEQARTARPSDAQRLQRAFERLEQHGVLARHYYGCTRMDRAGRLEEEVRIARASGRKIEGYVYYTMQDADDLDAGQLALAWGPITEPGLTYGNRTDLARAVARAMVDSLRQEGLETSWDGSPHSTLLIRGMLWRGPRDPETGDPLLPLGERLTWDGVDGATRTRGARADSRYALTSDDEWLVRVAYVSVEGIAAVGNLQRLSERMAGDGFVEGALAPEDFDEHGVDSFDFVPLALPPIDGRRCRFDAVATTMPVMGGSWASIVASSHGVVLVAADLAQLRDGYGRLRERFGDDLPPVVVQLEGHAWTHELVATAQEELGAMPVVRSFVLEDGSGTFDTLKAIARLTLADLKQHVERPTPGPSDG